MDAMASDADGSEFYLVGGNLALDFVNTVANRLCENSAYDKLQTSKDACAWAGATALPGFEPSKAYPLIAGRELRRIRMIRENLYVLFSSAARGERPSGESLAIIDEAIRRCRGKQCLCAEGRTIRWNWSRSAHGADLLLCPVLLEAAELLTSPRFRIKQCADPQCGWLFVDRSQGKKRRWCRMADCGNRAKARKYYRRHVRGQSSTSTGKE